MTMSQAEMEQTKQAAASTWWVYLLQGVAALLIGILLLTATQKTVTVLIALLGIYWMVSGVFNIVAALAGHVEEHKWWVIVAGVISIIAGLAVLRNMAWSTVVVPSLAVILLGIAALINGIVTIFAGRRQNGQRDRSWAGFFLGILYVIFGFLVLGNLLASAVALILAIAIWGIIGGIVLIVLAFRVKKLASS
ncbi:MAG TPA: DUF308 domain-containing protein [Chloroflexota bacterium]|nr:DUF308 domain-containing protein [Chloroflexota bacterium]HUM69554.1 DUF308 domain-containing protein [Chloroflexota bacterium]